MVNEERTLKDLTLLIRTFVEERNWTQYQRPVALAISAVIEMGELLELFQWLTDDAIEVQLRQQDYREKLADELADVLIYLLRLADVSGIDVAKAILSKMHKNSEKYPIEQWHGQIPDKIRTQ